MKAAGCAQKSGMACGLVSYQSHRRTAKAVRLYCALD